MCGCRVRCGAGRPSDTEDYCCCSATDTRRERFHQCHHHTTVTTDATSSSRECRSAIYVFSFVVCVLGGAACYSAIQDLDCRAGQTGSANDTIFWRRTCTSVASICSEFGFDGLDSKHCFHAATAAVVPVRKIIKRVLASEEFY